MTSLLAGTSLVTGLDGTVLHLLDGTVRPKAPFHQILIEANRALTDAEKDQLFELINYRWISVVRGQELEGYVDDSQNTIIVEAFSKYSFSSKPAERMDEFVEGLNDFIEEGSPIRITRNNTRLVEGIPDLTVHVWIDNVE